MSDHAHPTIKTFVAIWAALLVLTAITVLAAMVNLGAFSAVVALSIATVKALLVILYFMEIKYSSKLTMTVVISAVFFLMILLALTLTDYISRAWGTYSFQ